MTGEAARELGQRRGGEVARIERQPAVPADGDDRAISGELSGGEGGGGERQSEHVRSGVVGDASEDV